MKKLTKKIVSMVMVLTLFIVNLNLVLATTTDEVTSELPLELTIEDQAFQDEYDQMVEDELNSGGRLRSIDGMLLTSQQWLNATYNGRTGYVAVPEDGKSRRSTVNGLIRALQIELGITATAPNFGTGTITRFNAQYPNGVVQQEYPSDQESNVYGIIQCALWTKGYSVGSGNITEHFYDGTGNAVKNLKKDMGFNDSDSTVTLNVMKGLLSMDYYVTLSGGDEQIRQIQQELNRTYPEYLGIIPCDGVYGRAMNKALIVVLQAIEEYAPAFATGNFGDGTKSKLEKYVYLPKHSGNTKVLNFLRFCLICNGYGENIKLSDTANWDTTLQNIVMQFREDMKLPVKIDVDTDVWMALLLSKGNPDRECVAIDTNRPISEDYPKQLAYLKDNGYSIVGRYLSNSTKGIDIIEAKYLNDNNISFFPIYQEIGAAEDITAFTTDRGKQDAKYALQLGKELGLPTNSIIYFAVDFDPTTDEINKYVIPYFNSLSQNISNYYTIGVYGTRNVCTKVMNSGYATTCFVSDMSTGYSGNMGFKIPNNWNFDQFEEITTNIYLDKYEKYWDIDKVSYKGTFPTVTSLVDTVEEKAVYDVTEGCFVLDEDYKSNTGAGRLYSGRKFKVYITVTGENGQALNDGSAISVEIHGPQGALPSTTTLPIALINAYADGTTYTIDDFSAMNNDYILIEEGMPYYLKYNLQSGSSPVKVKVRVETSEY